MNAAKDYFCDNISASASLLLRSHLHVLQISMVIRMKSSAEGTLIKKASCPLQLVFALSPRRLRSYKILTITTSEDNPSITLSPNSLAETNKYINGDD